MKKLGVFLGAVLGVFVFASVASAGIMVTAPTFSAPNTSGSGTFTVTVTFEGSYNVAGYDVDLLLTGRSGATGLAFAGASGATTNYVFSLPHAGFSMQDNTASHIFGQDTLNSGTETLANVTKNLVTVNYTVAPGTQGVFDVALSNTDGFNDGSVSLGEGFTPGVITITPEPATMALLAVGALALVRRRR